MSPSSNAPSMQMNSTNIDINNIDTTDTTDDVQRQCQSALRDGTSRDAHERVCTVDEHNVPTLKGNHRRDVRLQNLWHRATYIIVRHMVNEKDDHIDDDDDNNDDCFLVQLRSHQKDYCPNMYDPAPGGVVGFGESYLENAQRELEEEMGILTYVKQSSTSPTTTTNPKSQDAHQHLLQRLFTFPYEDPTVKCWGDVYEVQYRGTVSSLVLQHDEVQSIHPYSLHQIQESIRQHPHKWLPDARHAFHLYHQYRHDTKIQRRWLSGYSSSNRNAYTLRPTPKVIFFDCDDCLYFDHWKTANQLTQKIETWCTQQKGLPPGYAYQLYKKYGTALKGLLAEGYIANTPTAIDQYLQEVHDLPISTLLSPDPKLRQMLERLDPSIPKFIFTASVKHHAQRCLQALGIDQFFPSDHIIDVKACHLETKHCRQSFDLAMQIANVGTMDPESCLFFDDSITNIQMGRQMGWRSVLVGTVGRDCGTVVSCEDAELELNSIHDIEHCFPELFVS